MPIFKILAYSTAAVIAVGLMLYFSDSRESILGQIKLDEEQNLVAYAVARNASTEYFDDSGQLSYSFQSDKLSHYRPSDDDSQAYTAAEKPYVVFYEDESPWKMWAERARIGADRNIELKDNVAIEYTDTSAKKTILTTQKLSIDTNLKLAKTDDAVTIRSPLGELTATGMEADIEARKIKLLSKVSGHHRPNILQ